MTIWSSNLIKRHKSFTVFHNFSSVWSSWAVYGRIWGFNGCLSGFQGADMSPTPTGPPAPDLNKPAVNKSIDTLSSPSLKFKPFTQLKTKQKTTTHFWTWWAKTFIFLWVKSCISTENRIKDVLLLSFGQVWLLPHVSGNKFDCQSGGETDREVKVGAYLHVKLLLSEQRYIKSVRSLSP